MKKAPRNHRILNLIKLALTTAIFGLAAGQAVYTLSGYRLWAALFVYAVIAHVAFKMGPEYDQPHFENPLDTLRRAAEGRVWKRLDEHRELAELITRKAPDLLNEQPWIAGWFQRQDAFLMSAAELCHIPERDDGDREHGVRKPPAWMAPSIFDPCLQNTGVQLCSKCHVNYGCDHEHSWLVHDTGTCSICGETNEVVNCRLANLAQNLGIPDEDVCRHLPRLVRNKNLLDVEREYRELAENIAGRQIARSEV